MLNTGSMRQTVRYPRKLVPDLVVSLLIFHHIFACCTGLDNILGDERTRCENISVDMCRDLPYTITMPADMEKGYLDQKSAQRSLTSFKPLVQSNCSPYLQFFLCSHYLPNCSPDWPHAIRSCRDVCEKVREDCEPLMIKHQHRWPLELDCSDVRMFPAELTDKEFCMPLYEVVEFYRPNRQSNQSTSGSSSTTVATTDPVVLAARTPCLNSFVLHHGVTGQEMCAPACFDHVKFTEVEKYYTALAVGVLSVTGLLLNVGMVLTFFTARKRFGYPERPVIGVAVWFIVFTITHFIGLFGGREMGCAVGPNGSLHSVLPMSYTPAVCAVQSLFSYFAFHSACLWWVMLAVSWFLTTSRKWSSEAVESVSRYFYLTVVCIPVALCVAILFWKKIDTDELSGVCGVGNFDQDALIVFVLIPMLLYSFTGGILVITGSISSLTVRQLIRASGRPEHIGKMIWKFSLYSLLFVLVLMTLSASAAVQLIVWHTGRVYAVLPEVNKTTNPVMYCRTFLPLLLTILAPGWIFNRKTLTSWKECCQRHSPKFHGRKNTAIAVSQPEQSFQVPLLGSSCSSQIPPVPWQTPASTDREAQSMTSWSPPPSSCLQKA